MTGFRSCTHLSVLLEELEIRVEYLSPRLGQNHTIISKLGVTQGLSSGRGMWLSRKVAFD